MISPRAFPVIARNSSFQFRGGNLDLKHVGSELGARYLVEGSVGRTGTRIRVTAQLIDAVSGEHVWAETYDREVTDLFVLQDEISAKIAASVAGDAARAEGERARQRGTEDLDAWSLYQLGQQHENWQSREGVAETRQYYEQAIARDPRFASAVARLAMHRARQNTHPFTLPINFGTPYRHQSESRTGFAGIRMTSMSSLAGSKDTRLFSINDSVPRIPAI